ncbi:MAG: hypothetical protein Q9166_003046 [cf. Caloplaca sp. 2 TL-2023]
MKTQPELLDLFAIHIFPEIVGLFPFVSVDSRTIEHIVAKFLCHANSQIRSIAFSLLTQSSSPKEPFTEKTLSLLSLVLPFYHVEVDPKARQDNVAMIKRLCLRLAGALKSLGKAEAECQSRDSQLNRDGLALKRSTGPKVDRTRYEEHLDFFMWYSDFLLQGLSPTGSYQRHIISLKVFDFLMSNKMYFIHFSDDSLDIGIKRKVSYKCFYDELLTSLLDLVVDPFDDVRALAASILHQMPCAAWSSLRPKGAPQTSPLVGSDAATVSNSLSTQDSALTSVYKPILDSVLQRAAEKMQGTARADHADGFGRLYDLVVSLDRVSDQGKAWCESDQLFLGKLMLELDSCIKTADVNIQSAVKGKPLHGYLIAVRYLVLRYNRHCSSHELDAKQSCNWREMIDELLEAASNVWKAVKDILCADAPEGHELEAPDGQTGIGAKDMLSFCWRALKESRSATASFDEGTTFLLTYSSTLMHSMVAGSMPTPILQVFQHRHYRKFGDLAFTELAELRHRGAFSTVSQTFAECCVRCAQSEDLETQTLLKEWYHKTLLCIQQHASALTRRSAGLPAMITGILSAKPDGEFFDEAIRNLLAIADTIIDADSKNKQLQLPQVHAFNCLKDISTDARFNNSVEQHMSASLEVAVRALESHRWAIRNCGLMLLKALITRLNDGTNTLSSKAPSSHRRLSSLVYDKYKNIPDLLLRLLALEDMTECEKTLRQENVTDTLVLRAQRVFPALEIIEQSGIPRKYQTEIRQAVWSHLEGSVWPIRDKAAKALSYFPYSEDIPFEIRRCLQDPWSTQNALHGRLLYLRHLVSRLNSDAESE